MDFSLTEGQELIYQEARRFGASLQKTSDRANRWAQVGKFGLLGACISKTYGGMGLNAVDTALALEGFSRGSGDTGFAFSIAAHMLACAKPIELHANEKIQKIYLPKLCSGDVVGANATTEAEAGSDTSKMRATAERSGDQYVLNGLKCHITNGPIADYFIVYAHTDRTQGYQGISAFLVDKDDAGLVRGPSQEKIGPCNSPIGEVYLTDCHVNQTHRLGNEGDGGAVFKSAMVWERACLFAIYIGQMDRELDLSIEHAKNRKQFGKAIGKFQAISHRIAEMKLRLESARLLLYRACSKVDSGADAMMDIAMAKIAVSESAVQSSMDCMQIFGGGGVLSEGGIEQGLRNSIPSTIFSGTSEIQRDLIARGLGL